SAELVVTVPSNVHVWTTMLAILLSWPSAVPNQAGHTASAINITRTVTSMTNSVLVRLTFICCSLVALPSTPAAGDMGNEHAIPHLTELRSKRKNGCRSLDTVG